MKILNKTHPENAHILDTAAVSVRISNSLPTGRKQERSHMTAVVKRAAELIRGRLTFLCPPRSTLCSR